MKLRKTAFATLPGRPEFAIALRCVLICIAWVAAGCGVPEEPVPPAPPVPVAVTDLQTTQVGDGVLLTFTLPKKSTRGDKLTQAPTLEVLRGSFRPDGAPNPKSFHVVDTVPGALLGTYVQAGKAQFLEHYAPEETRAHPGEKAVFAVRTRLSERRDSSDSNYAALNLYPVPASIEDLRARSTERSIDLTWTAPTGTSAGEPLSGPISFSVYRGELDPTSAPAAEKDLHTAVWKAPLLRITTTTTPEYQDSGFDWDKTYVYVVRTTLKANGLLLDSGDSNSAILTPKDIFPPAAPQDLVAAVLPGAQTGTLVVDLSWAINLETDMAGYRVYRSERENERGRLLTPMLLPSPAYRDTEVTSGQHYWYTVTAVDKAGNESAPNAPLLVEVR
jgi:hypothetical protein